MALCGADGGLLAQAEHIPVHVGAMTWAAKEVIEYFEGNIFPGDVFLLNDPYFGGSHPAGRDGDRAGLCRRQLSVLDAQPSASFRYWRRHPTVRTTPRRRRFGRRGFAFHRSNSM